MEAKKRIIIGLGGVATVGKDTFFGLLQQSLPDLKVTRYAFADALKKEVEAILWRDFKLDVWNLTPEQKKLARPFLVWWGCTKRHFDPDYWIKFVNNQILVDDTTSDVIVVTDVRFENEANWINAIGGKLIHISRTVYNETMGSEVHVPPANDEEMRNDPIVKNSANFHIAWPTVEPWKKVSTLTPYVEEVINHIITKP
jgi:hypothetical protein